MGEVEKITVGLPPEMASALRDAVTSGEYATVGDVIRDALGDWKRKRGATDIDPDEMRRLAQEGADSGPGIDADLVFARLHAKYSQPTSK